jgi:hypothetical protein
MAACTNSFPQFPNLNWLGSDRATNTHRLLFSGIYGYADISLAISVESSLSADLPHATDSANFLWVPMVEKAMVQLVGAIRGDDQSLNAPDSSGDYSKGVGPRALSPFPNAQDAGDILLPLRILSGGQTFSNDTKTIFENDNPNYLAGLPTVAWRIEGSSPNLGSGPVGHMVAVTQLDATSVLIRDPVDEFGFYRCLSHADLNDQFPKIGWAKHCRWGLS